MKCRRCERTLLRSHGEPMCLVHGPVEVPLVSAEEALAEVSPPSGRTRQRGPFTPTPPWTQSERLLWETWKEGDPVPEEPTNDEPYRSPASAGDAGIQTLHPGTQEVA